MLKNYNLSCEKTRRLILDKDYIDRLETIDEETKERLKNMGYIQ